ncbi:TPA: hypothetical protein HA246_07215 [Candidatus Woesearchaeota archaeon]|nr:hypothetical protein [Candidatus Woesearchaeota archaeon]
MTEPQTQLQPQLQDAEPEILIEEERYRRQIMIWGDEGQRKLANARVAVIGLDAQGVYLALCLTALGIGNVVLIDGNETKKDELFLDIGLPTGTRALSYSPALGLINKQVNIEGYPTNLESRIDQLLLENATVIVDATNSVRSKQLAVAYGREKGIPVLSTSSRQGYAKLLLANKDKQHCLMESLMANFEFQQQDALMALMMCGVTAEEVRKLIFDEREHFLTEPIRFQLGSGYRFRAPEKDSAFAAPNQNIYSGLSIAFLGGGALGCWGAIAASLMGFGRADVYDYDAFKSHNINRQVLAYDGIGKLKAPHLAEKIIAMSRGRTQSTGFNTLILPGFEPQTRYDLVFDFVDNRYTRAVNSAYAVSHGIPLISAGALPHSARWDIHAKGLTQCMGCVFDIYEEGRKEEMIRRASCADNPDPSVVTGNAIAAVCALLEAYALFEPEKFSRPFNGEYSYRANAQKRFGTSPLSNPCDCYSKPVPGLEISKEDVEAFALAHPELLRA